MSPTWTIVGVDCATQEERIGLARGTLQADGQLKIERVTLGTAGESAAASICQWMEGQDHFVLALDAPLGWPELHGATLATHKAGAALKPAADELFRRRTDRVVQKELGKVPIEVAADRIARTAHAALRLLEQVRGLAEKRVPLAWKQGKESGAIEVLPAATLLTRGLSSTGYKANTPQGRKTRSEILKRVASEVQLSVTHDLMIEDTDLLDALLCVLSGADYARGVCVEPDDLSVAKKEGFIWFRSSGQRALRY